MSLMRTTILSVILTLGFGMSHAASKDEASEAFAASSTSRLRSLEDKIGAITKRKGPSAAKERDIFALLKGLESEITYNHKPLNALILATGKVEAVLKSLNITFRTPLSTHAGEDDIDELFRSADRLERERQAREAAEKAEADRLKAAAQKAPAAAAAAKRKPAKPQPKKGAPQSASGTEEEMPELLKMFIGMMGGPRGEGEWVREDIGGTETPLPGGASAFSRGQMWTFASKKPGKK
jgi:hypothetical protein